MKQRARRAEDKEERRKAILTAALSLFEGSTFPQVKMLDVAQRSGLAKGTLFLYFPTKEALFLDLLEELLGQWLDEVDQLLENNKGRWTSSRVARVFTKTLAERQTLTRLLTLLSSVLEHNIDEERVHNSKRLLNARLATTGALLERRLPGLKPGEGLRLLLRMYAMVIGLRQLTDPGPSARKALKDPCLQSMVVDFGAELEVCLSALLRGYSEGDRHDR